MRDEASLRRLAEMGVDVYVSRGMIGAAAPVSSVVAEAPASIARATQVAPSGTPAAAATESVRAVEVLLLADVETPVATRLLADVTRALQFARIASAPTHARDESAIGAAAGLVMFGDAHARVIGALLPANRPSEIGWVVGARLDAIAVDARAKRALWSELRRMTRGIVALRQRTLAAAAAGSDHREH